MVYSVYSKLLEQLEKRGISRLQLAHMARIAPSDMYLALSGKHPMFPQWRVRIADALGLSVDELFEEDLHD